MKRKTKPGGAGHIAQLVKGSTTAAHLPADSEVDLSRSLDKIRIYRDLLAEQMEQIRTTRQLLDSTRKQQSVVLESSPLINALVDAEGRIQMMSKAGARILGAHVSFFTDRMFSEFVSPQDHPILKNHLRTCLHTGATEACELELCSADHRKIPVLITGQAAKWMAGKGQVIRLGIIDISDRKQKEAKLQDYALQLQEANASLQMRTSQLQRLSTQLCKAEQRERHRIADILHDHVQQILVACKMSVDVMVAQAPQVAEKGKEAASMLHEAINELRTLSSHLRPPALRDQGLLASLRWLAEEMQAKHRLTVRLHSEFGLEHLPPPMHDQLFQVVRELLFNVVKHAHTNEADVFFSIDGEAGSLNIIVRDAGRGIHTSANGSPKEHFGLSMIRERIAAHGGDIQIESSPGHGTAITLRLPLPISRDGEQEDCEGEDSSEDLAGDDSSKELAGDEPILKVLITDDHSIVRQGLAMLLKREPNIQVIGEAGNGEEALEFARRHVPDVVLMDVSMPRMDGVEATRRLKAEFPHIGVVGLSMHGEDEMADAIREAGADEYISKVAPAEELVGAIRRSLHKVT